MQQSRRARHEYQQLQRPLHNTSLPVYSVHSIRTRNNRPEIITIEATRRGGSFISPDQLYASIGNALQSAVYNELRNYPILWRNGRLLNRVTGILQMENITDRKHAHTRNIRPSELNFRVIQEIFERATSSGSNIDLSIYDVNFSYWINPDSFIMGAGNGSKTWAESTKGIVPITYKTPSGEYPINCAASSLVYLLAKSGYYGNSFKAHVSRNTPWYKKSYEFMRDLQWEETISISQLEDFTQKFSEYRVVCVDTTSFQGSHDYSGVDYVFKDDECILYLYYCYKKHHFYAIRSIQKFISTIHGISAKWCHQCAVVHRTNSCTMCSEKVDRQKKEVYHFCDLCGKSVYGKHTCFVKNCKTCSLSIKEDDLEHRCLIFANEPKPPKRFNGEIIDYEDKVDRSSTKKLLTI